MKKIFITGTDTAIGKTYIACGLLRLLAHKKISTVAVKPVAAGVELINGNLANRDAMLLQQCATYNLPYQNTNPILLTEYIAPHLAARHDNIILNSNALSEKCRPAFNSSVDVAIVEGCGGWQVPLNENETMADWAIEENLEIIMVVGMRLGCLNHSLLTYAALQKSKLKILGWIANCIDPEMPYLDENIVTLNDRMHCPLLGIVPFNGAPEKHLHLSFRR